jgi:hypothetical protein
MGSIVSTFSPVAKLTTYRVIFALAALEKWEIHGMDVITAYLLGKLDEEIYIMQPEGFFRMGMKRNMVCRLLKSLYGLKQAARVWNQKIHAKIGFVSTADLCLYIVAKRCIYITIWIDGLLVCRQRRTRHCGSQASAFQRIRDEGPWRTLEWDVSVMAYLAISLPHQSVKQKFECLEKFIYISLHKSSMLC